MREPMLRAFMQEEVPPGGDYPVCPGRWVAEPVWPPRAPERPSGLHLNAGGALRARAGRAVDAHAPLGADDRRSPAASGVPTASAATAPSARPTSARTTRGASCSRRAPLRRPLEILGQPAVRLTLAVDKPVAFVAVRLNDVFPDGRVSRVTFGVLNLTHRDSHETPTPMPVGKRLTVRVPLNDIAYSFKAGPPDPRRALDDLLADGLARARAGDPPPHDRRERAGAAGARAAPDRPEGPVRAAGAGSADGQDRGRAARRPSASSSATWSTGTVTVRAEENEGRAVIVDTGVEMGRWVKERLTITEGDPLSAETEMGSTFTYAKGAVADPCRRRLPAPGDPRPSGYCPPTSTPGRATRRSSAATSRCRSRGTWSDGTAARSGRRQRAVTGRIPAPHRSP